MLKSLCDEEVRAAGFGLAHHFGGKAYIKETHLVMGSSIGQHAHDFDHLAVLVRGHVVLVVDGVAKHLDGFHVLKVEAGKTHDIHAVSDAVWLCVWGTDCTDPAMVDAAVLKGE